MYSLYIFIVYTILIIILGDNTNIYFTQSSYDIWCQENILFNSLFLYPNRIPIGIYHRLNIKSIVYHIIDDQNNDLFDINTKRLANFYFLTLNITRPFDINREYQDVYVLNVQANIITIQGNRTEQVEIHLHVADSNDNDGVFDMDIYDKSFNESIDTSQSLIRFHASDADEIPNAQILYELSSPFNDTFSLHPFTGELYFLSKQNLQTTYQFDIYAYDRHRKDLIHNNIKTNAHVKLNFLQPKLPHTIITISKQTINFQEIITSYKISFSQRKNWNLLTIHQAILTINIYPNLSSYEIFILNNSSRNSNDLLLDENNIYLNNSAFQEYNLHFLLCFFNRTKCQYANYHLSPSINLDLFQFHFKSIQSIFIEEDLPIHSFITYIQIHYNNSVYHHQQLDINYKLLDNHNQFYLHSKTGILRLAEHLKYQKYSLDIQAEITLFNKNYSIVTKIEININEINKYSPSFRNDTLKEIFQLPYQFQAIDLDENEQTNGRITYRLWNCLENCPFQINPNNGILSLIEENYFREENIYYLQIIAFDWGQPISLETSIDIRIYLSSKLIRRDLASYSRRLNKQSTLPLLKIPKESLNPPNTDTIYLNIGFNQNSTSYHLSEDSKIDTIIDRLKIEYDSFPLNINNEKESLFFYTINDTSVPFTIDPTDKTIKLLSPLDREKQDRYIFEIELTLKSTYIQKLQEIYNCQKKTNSSLKFQYTKKYSQKLLILIDIDDINDNIPICNYSHKHIYLNENQIQTNIFHIQANDPDLGDNGTILYSLLDHNQYFTINSYTGQISCIKSIDREQISSLLLYIIASDQGQQLQLQSICTTLHITIVDINDNSPQFSLANYTYYLYSDLPRFVVFGQIYATDSDSTDNLIYSIDSNPYIIINRDTGHLRLRSNLYSVSDQILNITVRVSDDLHINQTWIFIHVKRFIEAQQPILLSEPAYSIIINQTVPVGTIITNVYHRLQLSESSIDYIDMINEDNIGPFTIDQQGSIHLIHSLIGLPNSSYWLSIRLTRYRARPPHSFIHIHISIREENFYLPQCVDIYQNIKLYDYSTDYPFARVQALSIYNNIYLQYSIIKNKKIFSINKQTGFIRLLPSIENNNQLKSIYLLTIRALDNQHQVYTDCYLKVNLIRRRQLIPKFVHSSIYKINLPEIRSNSKQLRQRLFQVIALLDNKVYDKKLEVRYRIVDINQYFIINRQTGYIAAKQPLSSYTTYEFNVEAFTIAYRDDISSDGNDDSFRRNWQIVSSRVILPIKIQIIPMNTINSSFLSITNSRININLSTTTKVGSSLLQLRKDTNHTQWFIMIGHIDHTRYFHIDVRSGELILIRPIEELIPETTIIELHINITNDWIHMNTIKVIVHIINPKLPLNNFSLRDYYSSVSKNIPIGIEIAHFTIQNSSDNCTYYIHSVERLKSKNFFHIYPYSGSVTVVKSLDKLINDKHLLTIIYRCQSNSQIVHTHLHINILDKDKPINNSYRFTQENYLIIFETSLISNRKMVLMNFELISNDYYGKKIKPDAQIVGGDPLGLFSIDSSNQSLIFLDQSRSRSYIYPIQLTITDKSQTEPINCTVTIILSNIGIQFTCSSCRNISPYLLTYESSPRNSIDPLTGQQYTQYDSLIIRVFDPYTPSSLAECLIKSEIPISNKTELKNLDFKFDNEISHINSSLHKTLFQFQLYKPFVNNYTIGFVNSNFNILNPEILSRFSIDNYGRLFIKNESLILNTGKKFYDFIIENHLLVKARIEINILSKQIIQCSLNRFNQIIDKELIGFIRILNRNQTESICEQQSFYLMNYNHLFLLEHQHGLLRFRNEMITNDLKLLIEIENSRCWITFDGSLSTTYMISRNESDLEKTMQINKPVPLSSMNLTIYLRKSNENQPELLTENSTTLFCLFYPSMNTILYKIEAIDNDQSNLLYKIVNNTFSSYILRPSSNSTELILIEPILNDREDNLIIHLWNNNTFSSSYLHLRLIYIQRQINLPIILREMIDGYINFENHSIISLGQLFIQNHSQYQFIYFNLISNEHFFLKQISNNQTELHFKSTSQYSSMDFQIHLTAIAIQEPIPEIHFHNNTIILLPSTIKPQSIDIHLWPVNHEILDRTISLIINLNTNTTYKKFIMDGLPLIRQNIAEIINVHTHHVHIYTFKLKQNQIELLLAVVRYPSGSTDTRYIHKKLLYNALKNSTNLFEKILLNQCNLTSCENNAYCTSYINLLNNQYEYFSYKTYQRLIPKYQWNIKCLCPNDYYGQRCQFKQEYPSPCSSNPCLPMEKCIEQNSTLYSCQCIEDLCYYNDISMDNSLECININSPTCRDSSNTLTFDGYSFVRLNLTLNITEHINITLSFRTQLTQGKLLELIYFDEKRIIYHTISIRILHGYINIELNKVNLFELNQILINDNLWHDIYLSIDYSDYLLRLDYVFSKKINLSSRIHSNNLIQLIIGTDFDGCLGNLTLNNQIISLQQKQNNLTQFIEHIGTNNGCQLTEIIREYTTQDDFCSLYHPCYHGGICLNQGLNFTCNCSKTRFTGRQCQLDLQPCESNPCRFDEQCISLSLNFNKSFSCIPLFVSLSILTKIFLYFGLFGICILFVLVIWCVTRRKEKFIKDKPFVSTPLLIEKSSAIENPMETLLKFNFNEKHTIERRTFVDNKDKEVIMDNPNDRRNNYQSYESLNHYQNTRKYYSTIEQLNIPSNNLLGHYNTLNNISSSRSRYFNIHNSDNRINYRIHINSFSNLTKNLVENNDQILLTPSITNRDRKRSFVLNSNNKHTSTLSLSKAPIYARTVKTSKITNGRIKPTGHRRSNDPLTSSPTSLLNNNETYRLTTTTIRHASDSDLLKECGNEKRSTKLSSYFQTEV